MKFYNRLYIIIVRGIIDPNIFIFTIQKDYLIVFRQLLVLDIFLCNHYFIEFIILYHYY